MGCPGPGQNPHSGSCPGKESQCHALVAVVGTDGSQLGRHGLSGRALREASHPRRCDMAPRFCAIVSCFCDMAAPGHGAVPDNLCQPCPEPGHKSARTERGQSPCGAGSWWRSSSTMNARDFPWLLPLALLVILGRPLDTSSRPIGDARTSAVLAEAPEQRDVGPGTTPWGRMSLLCWAGAALDLLSTGVSLSRWLCGWLRRRWGQVRGGRRSRAGGMVPGVGERPRAAGRARVGRNLRAPAEEESRAGPRGRAPLGQPFAQGPEAAGEAQPLGGNRARAQPQEHRAEAPPGAARAGGSVSRRGQRRPWRAQPPIGAPLPPLIGLPALCPPGEAPEPLGLCRDGLPGTRPLQGAAAAAEGQPCPDAAVPAPPPSAEARGEEAKEMGRLEEEENLLLPLTVLLQPGSPSAAHGRGCLTRSQPGHCDIPHHSC